MKNFFTRLGQDISLKIRAISIAMKMEQTPIYAKIACGICVFYALSPIDIIPDFIPILGYLDDILILPFLMWLAVKLIPDDIMAESSAIAKSQEPKNLKSRMIYAFPILAIWFLIGYWIFTLIKNWAVANPKAV